jgi:hypothetical protein
MFFCSFAPLLELEQQSDEAVLRERLSSWSLARLQQEGYCITDLYAYWLDANNKNFGMGRFVASFVLGPGITLPAEHRFEYVVLQPLLTYTCINLTARSGVGRRCWLRI